MAKDPSQSLITKTNLPALRPVSENKITELRRASNELEKLDLDKPGQILKWAGQMDLMRSSVLAGFLGGAVGSTAGITLGGIAIAGFALPVAALTGPLGMAAGVAVAILAFRGPERLRIEKQISNGRLLLEEIDNRYKEIMNQIGALPKNTPDEVRGALWDEVHELIRRRRAIENSYGHRHTVEPEVNLLTAPGS
jgi:hypothetical protein